MSNSKISLEDFLRDEAKQAKGFLAVVESLENNDKQVSVSVWEKNACSCHTSIKVPKELIESIERTEHTHFCCGEYHSVLKINFKQGAAISVEEVLSQLATNGNGHPVPHPISGDYPIPGKLEVPRFPAFPLLAGDRVVDTRDRHYLDDIWDGITYCRKSNIYPIPSRFPGLCYDVYRNTLTGEECKRVARRC
ncbi:hypothetical protein [Paraflavitalea sp. CAU 1676]|uniref:hypothetical protein n=1 Tax=Paraflavitalea sp. CAU 1676 TaxID=3032598 RepID=UPI0023DABCD3|nr:hypothetical protein [Paraflavitalea sp. CAU 1676]MDF2190179.1 hypothetical protein [Paraflavitalea sp. CAU 1676]